MKQGTRCVLPVTVDIDLDSVESIKFVFKQNVRRLTFDYPSENAIRDCNNINLIWSQKDTHSFEAGKVLLDTFIRLNDSIYNPPTEIAEFSMSPTLFTLQEITYD